MEEQVGAIWHRFISRMADANHPEAAVSLCDIKSRLSVFYHALSTDACLGLDGADAIRNPARRGLLQRLAGAASRIRVAFIEQGGVALPVRIAQYDDSELNRELYFWLTAMASVARSVSPDTDTARFNQRLTCQVLERFPGMRKRYRRLAEAHIRQRISSPVPGYEQNHTEKMIIDMILEPGREITSSIPVSDCYSVPLWLHMQHGEDSATSTGAQDSDGSRNHSQSMRELEGMGKRNARRVDEPDSQRGLITVRMENIFSMGEFVNVDRGSEEEDDIERAESVARELDELSVSRDARSATATLKFDLDLPPANADDSVVGDGLLLPEWDWKASCLKPEHCRIVEMVADRAPACELPAHLNKLAGRLRKQFQALAPSRHWQYAQPDGQDVDLDAYIRFASERSCGTAVANNMYRDMRDAGRELSCLLLADLSLSTDAYIDDKNRVIDVIRDSLFLFAECLHANGDRFSLYGFSSRRRDPVRLHRLKAFSDSYDATVRGRIDAIKPGYYTRMGAAIRFAARRLVEEGTGKRLLLVLTDGKPNDLDQYEGRYGIEDTRNAVQEARRQGLIPFCVTIDRKGSEYLPHLFGMSNYVVIRDAARLPRELPRLYALFAQAGG